MHLFKTLKTTVTSGIPVSNINGILFVSNMNYKEPMPVWVGYAFGHDTSIAVQGGVVGRRLT